MTLVHQSHEARCIDMRIDLGGGDIGMAQQRLQYPQIGPAFQQMGGKGIPQGMTIE